MKDKKLRRLSRGELLELLLAQTRETERLQQRLQEAEAELAERSLKIQNAGDLAHASLAVNNVLEAAQQAANQYLENIASMEAEVSARCAAMEAEVSARCAAMEAAATARAEELISDAQKKAALILKKADSDGEMLAQLHEILDVDEELPGETDE